MLFHITYADLYFMKNMISSVEDHMHENHGNLKINKERKIHLLQSS